VKQAIAYVKVGNQHLFWQSWVSSCLRWVTDSNRRASDKAPKEADRNEDAFVVLIFHTALKKRSEFLNQQKASHRSGNRQTNAENERLNAPAVGTTITASETMKNTGRSNHAAVCMRD
jgi:hypothetical protein